MPNSAFYTLRGYDQQDQGEISRTMEDYLEMICRHAREGKYIRVNQLATLLNVRPPSASKMAAKLRECGMVEFEPYGIIQLTSHGKTYGDYLLHRHDTLHRLFCRINRTDDVLELVERIEHYFDRETIGNIEDFLAGLGE